MPWKTGCRADTEKNVPHRNVMGRMIRLLNVARLAWDFAMSADAIPRNENTMHDMTVHTTNRGVRTSSIPPIPAAPSANPRPYSRKHPNSPLINPSMHLPQTIAWRLSGHIIISSKLL